MPSKKDINANGLGTLNAKQKITMDMASKAISATPGPMPQVNKILTITYRQMVLDGTFSEAAGSKVLIDPTATGTFETGAVEAKILGTIPGDITEKQPSIQGTTVVGQDAKFQVQIPDGLVCTGPVSFSSFSDKAQANPLKDKTCLMRVVNGKNTGNNHWGGHVIFQLAADDKAANATLTQDSTTTTDATNKKAGTKKTGTTKKAGNAARAARSIKQRQADLDDLASRLAAVQVPDS